jgi:hypothetical protein
MYPGEDGAVSRKLVSLQHSPIGMWDLVKDGKFGSLSCGVLLFLKCY